jgi:hypothetical protein
MLHQREIVLLTACCNLLSEAGDEDELIIRPSVYEIRYVGPAQIGGLEKHMN